MKLHRLQGNAASSSPDAQIIALQLQGQAIEIAGRSVSEDTKLRSASAMAVSLSPEGGSEQVGTSLPLHIHLPHHLVQSASTALDTTVIPGSRPAAYVSLE
jgi:hypothetical protein